MVLLIDGNYFAQRIRNGCELTFMTNPQADEEALIEAAATSLAYEIKSLGGAINHVMITRDWTSWRKTVEVVQPEQPMDRVKGKAYKANRDELDKDYDPIAFYKAYDKFCQLCEDKLNIPTIKSRGAEADDAIYVMSKILEKQGYETLCWSSDGDYLHLVSDKFFYLKFPKKDLHLPVGMSKKAPKSMMDVFNNAAPSRSKLLMESLHEDSIKETNPAHSLIVKVVYGDEKDNVPPLFTWWSKNHSVQYRPSEGKIKKTFANLNIDWDSLTIDFLYDEKAIKTFIKELLVVTKQTDVVDAEHAYKVFVSSRKMKHLNSKEIPKDLISNLIKVFNEKKHLQPNLDLCSNYQKIIQSFGKIEQGSYFAGLNLES